MFLILINFSRFICIRQTRFISSHNYPAPVIFLGYRLALCILSWSFVSQISMMNATVLHLVCRLVSRLQNHPSMTPKTDSHANATVHNSKTLRRWVAWSIPALSVDDRGLSPGSIFWDEIVTTSVLACKIEKINKFYDWHPQKN